jgi:hypothetical protein
MKIFPLIGALLILFSTNNLALAAQNTSFDRGIYCNLELPKKASYIMTQFNAQPQAKNKQPFKLLFGDGEWVVKTFNGNIFTKYYIDMDTGNITNYKEYTAQHAFDFYKASPWKANSNSLAEVVISLEKAGYVNIEFVVWSGTYFKSHVCKDHKWYDVVIETKKDKIHYNLARPSLEIQ